MGCEFRQISYDEIKGLNISDKRLIFSPHAQYYALVDGDIVKSVISVKVAKNGVKLQGNYTFPEYRGQGLFTKLLRCIMNIYSENINIYADCLNTSVGIYLRNGFELYEIKEYKSFTIYKVRLLSNG